MMYFDHVFPTSTSRSSLSGRVATATYPVRLQFSITVQVIPQAGLLHDTTLFSCERGVKGGVKAITSLVSLPGNC